MYMTVDGNGRVVSIDIGRLSVSVECGVLVDNKQTDRSTRWTTTKSELSCAPGTNDQ